MTSVEQKADEPQSADTEAQEDTDDIDALLKSYEQQDQKPEKSEKKTNGDDVSERLKILQERLDELEQSSRMGEQRKDLAEAVKTIKASHPALGKLRNQTVENMLVGQGLRDQRLEEAFKKRYVDPKGWAKVLKAVAKDFAADFDKDEDEDVDAVLAASRGISTRRTDDDFAKKVSNMSSAEFAKLEQSLAK